MSDHSNPRDGQVVASIDTGSSLLHAQQLLVKMPPQSIPPKKTRHRASAKQKKRSKHRAQIFSAKQAGNVSGNGNSAIASNDTSMIADTAEIVSSQSSAPNEHAEKKRLSGTQTSRSGVSNTARVMKARPKKSSNKKSSRYLERKKERYLTFFAVKGMSNLNTEGDTVANNNEVSDTAKDLAQAPILSIEQSRKPS